MGNKKLWQAVWNRRMLICVFTGFASGLPLYVLITLVPAWLRSEGQSLKDIGLFALIGFPYTWKFLWAPIMDRFVLPFLGRRRGWMLVSQICLLFSIGAFGLFKPEQNLWAIAYLAALVAIFSASQDIVIDAYRREILPDEELGLGNSIHVNAYRIAGLIPGSLSLILADSLPWHYVFPITASFMLVGVFLTLMAREPQIKSQPRTIKEAVIDPFKEFIGRQGWRGALLILAFMFLYKIGDNMATALSTPFYIDMGFSLSEIGLIAKHAGLWPAVIGGLLGGLLMVKIGINRALWLFGFVQMITILGFAFLSQSGPDKLVLAIVISLEYLGVGLGNVANLLNIERGVIGGGVAQAGNLILEPARKSLALTALAASRDAIEVVEAILGNKAGLVGAARLAMSARQPLK